MPTPASSPGPGTALPAHGGKAKRPLNGGAATAKVPSATSVDDASLNARNVVASSLHVGTAVEPTSNGEAVSFTVSRQESANFDLSRAASGEEKVDILDTGVVEKESEITVSNASAWLSLGASTAASNDRSSGKVPPTDFERFKRLNEEKKIRERVDAEEALKLKKAKEDEEIRKAHAIEERRKQAQLEREQQSRDAQLQAKKKEEDELAERIRLREQAKREREALTGTLDIHEQNNAMMDFTNEENDDDGLDGMLDE